MGIATCTGADGTPIGQFCAISGRSEEKTRLRAEQFGVRWYLDVGEMLDREKPDLVNVSLPNEDHFSTTLRVIETGHPLFVEKPLVFQLEEAVTLLEEAQKRGLFFGINFNHRYAKLVQMTKAAIEGGQLGEIVFVT